MSLAAGIRAGRAFVEIGANSAPLEAALQRMRAKIQSFGAGLAAIGTGLIGASAGVASVLAWPLTLAANMEQAQAKFETMLGSADAATKMLADIRAMAAATPFETTDLVGATETLLGFGVGAGEVLGILQQLGDASGGNAERFKSLALVFGQVAANGRLMGGDVLQMVNAGFNPLQEIAKTTGESMEALKKRMEAGKVSLDEVKKAFASATGPGGRFFGLMEKQSQTLIGRLSTLKDSLAEAVRPLGEALLPIVGRFVNEVSGLVMLGGAWIAQNKDLAVYAAAAAAAIGGVGVALVAAGGAIYAAGAGLGVLGTVLGVVLSPLGLLAAGAIAVTTALGGWANGISVAQSAIEGLFNWAVAEFGDLADTLGATWQGVSQAIAGGDTQAAFGVLTAGIELSWLQMADKMKGTWGDFKAWFLGGWIDIKTTIAAEMAFVVLKFDEAFVKIKNGMANLFDGLMTEAKNLWAIFEGKGLQSALGPFALGKEDALARMVAGDIQGNVSSFESRQAARRVEMDKAENAFFEFLKTLDQDAKNEKRAIAAERSSEALEAAQQRLNEANKRFSEALDKAAAVEQKAAEKRGSAIDTATGKAKSTFTDTSASMGQFNASFAGRQVGFRDVQDRIARATEDTAAGVKNIEQKIGMGIVVA